MEQLWAPWRNSYVTSGERPAGCIFCAAAQAAAQGDELPSTGPAELVVARGKLTFSLLNRYPYNNGHLMVVPYDHRGDIAGLEAAARAELLDTASAWTELLAVSMGVDGFNVGFNLGSAAGAGLAEHVHLHLVPRWHGDTNLMPVVGSVKVIPEDLAVTRDRLRAVWRTSAS